MSSAPKKRVTVKLKCPNPLFERWLTEWLEEAKAKDSRMQYCFTKALQSLKKYPLPLDTGKECKILQGFGGILCQMLDDKLKNHQENPDGDEKVVESVPEVQLKRKSAGKQVVPKEIKEISASSKEYLPKYQSGPYAILVALYQSSLKPEYKGYLTKEEIITEGKFLCEKSFTEPEPGTHYTAWSSMRTLLEKNLVDKKGKPSKFSLTDQGLVIAHKLYRTNLSDEIEQKNIQRAVSEHKQSEDFDDIICLDDDFDPNFNVSKEISDLINIKEIRLDVGDKKSSIKGSRSKLSQKLKSTQSEIEIETVILTPDSFDIILLVDTQETSGAKQAHDDPIVSDLLHLGVNFEIRHLKVGDYLYICRDRQTNFELVLPYVIERKRMDDFASSIKDGRYHEQKFRLKKCGIQNVTYLVENFGKNEKQYTGLPLSTLMQAATNTLVQDGFQVKFCDNSRSTAHYLNAFMRILNRTYKCKTLMSCPKSNLEKSTVKDDLIPLLTFKEFTKMGSKHKTFTVREMFIKHLLQLKGLSIDKALAIVEKYPTPKKLKEAYSGQPENPETLLANVQFGKNNKKIGPVISRAIYQLYTSTSFT